MTSLNFITTLATMSNHRRTSAAWLSYDMARALAATCPPLSPKDVISAADELAACTNPVPVIGRMLRLGSNLPSARGVVEALRALRDLPA
jgi:stage III sporulation protein SpoIIIAA